MHDFNIFDDRAALLWRKPWTDGMARELTSGDNRSVDELREAVEKMILTKRDRNPKVVAQQHPSMQDQGTIRIDVEEDNEKEVLKDIKKNREYYEADD
jgi:PAB1-binding protein PBP1